MELDKEWLEQRIAWYCLVQRMLLLVDDRRWELRPVRYWWTEEVDVLESIVKNNIVKSQLIAIRIKFV